MTTTLAGKVAVVTGASRGIGKQTCLALAELGASLVLASRTEAPRERTPGTLNETAAAIRTAGGDALVVRTDLARQTDLERLISVTLERHGHVDILVNNAAYTVGKALWAHVPELTREQWEKGFAVNVTAPLVLIEGFWDSMRARGGGVIVNVTSGAANLQPLDASIRLPGSTLPDNGPLYGASKAALNRMANVIAGEGATHNIAVINLEPGFVLTETMEQTFGETGVDGTEMGALPPTVPARAIAHLCSCDNPMQYSGQIVSAPELVNGLRGERRRMQEGRRVLVSADSHGGAPLGEMEVVAARGNDRDAHGTSARIGVRVLENAFKKNPEIHPEDRIREADLDGVVAEVVYGFTGIPEGDFADGVRQVQAANDWSADVYGDHLGRFAPSVCLPLPIERYGARGGEKPTDEHIAAAAAEIRRTKAMGLRPALLPDHCDALPLNLPEWNPVWEAACEVNMPLAFHVGVGRNPVQHRGPGGAITNYAMVQGTIMETASHLAAGGVFEQFPELKAVCVECGSGWLAWLMHVSDDAYVKHAHWTKPKLPMPPSEYLRRQLQVTFQEDPIGIANRHFTGLRCLMWGSDYPHHEGTWPDSQAAVAKQFAGVPEDEIDQIVRRNAVETFEFDI